MNDLLWAFHPAVASPKGDGRGDLQLIELLMQVDDWKGDAGTIYVERPWSLDAKAIVVHSAPYTIDAIGRDGKTYHYFLETFVARKFLDEFARTGDGTSASDIQKYDCLVRYARDYV